MRRLLFSVFGLLLLAGKLIAAEEAPPPVQDAPAPPQVDATTIPSLVNLTSMPSAIVNGCVNVITGDFCESDEEDVLFSPDPYVLGHTYFSSSLQEGNLGAGWNFLHHHLIEVFQESRIGYTKDPNFTTPYLFSRKAVSGLIEKGIDDGGDQNRDRSGIRRDANNRDHNDQNKGRPETPTPLYLSLYDPSGGRLLYKTKYHKKDKIRSLHSFKLESKLTGYTNVVGGRMSGQTNLKNIKLKWDKQTDTFLITLGDGTKRIYERQWTTKEMNKKDSDRSKHYRDYHLSRELKPNGNSVVYSYNDKHEIIDIKANSRDGAHTLYSVSFDQRTTGDFAKHPNLTVHTSDGFGHTYFFKKLDGSYMHGTYSVSHIRRQGHPFTNFVYSKKSSHHKRRVIRKETEGGYYTSTKYYRKASNWMNSRTITPKDKKERKFLHNRVRMQLAPVGKNGQEVITHRYFYYKDDNGGGHCTVRDAHNNISRHYWNKDKRLIRVTKSDSSDKRLMSEKYYWGENDTDDEGRLLCRVLQDESFKPILAHTFKYDAKGNVIEDALWASLTENSGALQMDDGIPQDNSCDKQLTKFTYTDDGFNLVASMCDPLGNYTYYEYVPGTNLLAAKYICIGTAIAKREFFSYDKCGIGIEHVVDDGVAKDKNNLEKATERHITRTKPRYTNPRFGEPEEVMELAYNFTEQKEVYLSKIVNHFNDKGFVAKRECVDQLGGRLFYEFGYDEVGRVTYSKDPLGRIERTEYDLAGRIQKKSGPRKDVSWHYEYDVAGRLIKETEKHTNGLELTTKYEYDALSRKTAVYDAQNNITRYEYDALNRVTAIIYPVIFNHEGKAITPKKTYSYKNLGTRVTEVDENGLITESTYNALGKLCHKKHPDKTKLAVHYDLKGNAIKEVAANGAVHHIEYDAFSRVTESRLMMQDELLSKATTTYNAFHPLVEKGPSGEKIAYSYDYAGRKASVELQGKRSTTYVYDAKSRVIRERCQLDVDAFIGKRYKYNELGQVTYESYRDHKERVKSYKEYGYDVEGNKKSIKQEIGGKRTVSRTTYLPNGLPSSEKDAEGNKTTYAYDFHYINKYGQTVRKKSTKDAKGTTHEEVYDTRGKVSECRSYDPMGLLLAKKELFYDAAGNLVRSHEYAISDGQELKCIVTLLSYKHAKLSQIIEAAGTSEEKITRYKYNDKGQKKSATYSDGTILRYRYDSKGRVRRYFAADKSIDYRYEYDASDRILSVTNAITGKTTTRQYNRFGELKQEVLETGLTLSYRYDNAGRPIATTLPDGSKVLYEHSAFLDKITRQDAEGLIKYSHSILERDKSGLKNTCELIDGSKIAYKHDKLGRCKKSVHAAFQEKALKHDELGNVLQLDTTDAIGAYSRSFSYNYLSQLIAEDGPKKHTYNYDSVHNRLEHNGNAYSVNSLHSVLSDSKRTFVYDVRGNRTSMQVGSDNTRYKYDALDRLIEVETPENTRYIYVYDGFNRRVLKEAYSQDALGWKKEATTKYIFTRDDEIGSTDEANTICELRILGEGLGAEIGASIAFELSGNIYTPLHDRQGSVVAILDSRGQVVEHYRFDAFGNETTSSMAPINPWRFSSKRVDPETGMINFGRRYYDPTLGKWLTQDPLGLKAGPNLYAYCLNNPLSTFDLYGLLEQTDPAERSFSDRAKDFISDGIRTVRDYACRALETIIHHGPHFGRANNNAENEVRGWRNASPLAHDPSGLYEVSSGVTTSSGCIAAAYANGMKCNLEEAKKNLKKLLEQFPDGAPPGYILYSESKGFTMDFCRAILNKLGVTTSNIEGVSEGMQYLSDKVAQSDTPNAYALIVPHSLGGNTVSMAASNLDPKILSNFCIESVASSKMFHQNQGYKSARNYGGWSDPVPIISDPAGLVFNGFRGNWSVNMVGHPAKIPLWNHGFQSNEYAPVLKKVATLHG